MVDFVLSDEGQKQFALTGFRPIRDDVDFGGTVEGASEFVGTLGSDPGRIRHARDREAEAARPGDWRPAAR